MPRNEVMVVARELGVALIALSEEMEAVAAAKSAAMERFRVVNKELDALDLKWEALKVAYEDILRTAKVEKVSEGSIINGHA